MEYNHDMRCRISSFQFHGHIQLEERSGDQLEYARLGEILKHIYPLSFLYFGVSCRPGLHLSRNYQLQIPLGKDI